MKQKDMRIITYLRTNARMPLTLISRKTKIPVSTIFDRLKANENNIIIKHTSLIDFSKLGYNIRTNIAIKVDRNDKEALKKFLIMHHAANSVYKVSNEFDFMVECIFKQIKDMDEFMENLENKFKIQEKKAYFIIEDIKKEAFMSNPDLLP